MTEPSPHAPEKPPRIPAKEWVVVAALGIAGLGGWFAWKTWGPVSASERDRYGERCRAWITEEYGEGRTGRLGDDWRRRGRIVFEILIPDRERPTTSNVFLCVYDPSAHRMLKPSAWDTSWR